MITVHFKGIYYEKEIYYLHSLEDKLSFKKTKSSYKLFKVKQNLVYNKLKIIIRYKKL